MSGQERRVVVTGVGLVSPLGTGAEKTWQGLLAGEPGIAPITLFDATGFACNFAGEVKDFDPQQFIDRKDIKKMAKRAADGEGRSRPRGRIRGQRYRRL